MDFSSHQAPQLQERLSLPAVATAALLHVALLWFILQTTPEVQITRQVVYQLLTPITRVAEPTPIAPPPPPVKAPKPRPTPTAPPVPLAVPATAPVPVPAEAPTAAPTTLAMPDGGTAPIGNSTGTQRPEYPYLMNRQPRQKSYAELAREQLNPGGPRNKFAAAIDGAEKPDCLAGNPTGDLLAAPLIVYKAATGKCK